MGKNMIDLINEDEYDINIVNSKIDKIIIIKFSAPWCEPCKKIQPFYEQLSKDNKDLLFYNVNIDNFGDIQDKENIYSIPYFIAYNKGVKINSIITSKEQDLNDFINNTIIHCYGKDEW